MIEEWLEDDNTSVIIIHHYSQACVKRPYTTRQSYCWLFIQVVAYCCMKEVQKAQAALLSFNNKQPCLSIAISCHLNGLSLKTGKCNVKEVFREEE